MYISCFLSIPTLHCVHVYSPLATRSLSKFSAQSKFGGMQHLLPFENMRAANASLAPLFIVAIKLKLMLNGHALCVTVDQEEVQWAVLI